MRKTKKTEYHVEKILVDTCELQEILCSGRAAAVNIGTAAGARVQNGRRVFWNVKKVQQYVDAISG